MASPETPPTVPTPAELAEAAIIDGWEWALTGPPRISGRVAGSYRFDAGSVITTSEVVLINVDRTWIRTRNSIYVLGYQQSTLPPVVRAASAMTWSKAFRLLVEMTGRHTLTGEINIALDVAEMDWPSRYGTGRLIADEMYLVGRRALGSAWLLLAAGNLAARVIAHGELARHASDCQSPEFNALILGWKMLGEGLTLGENITDPIAAAYRIGDRHVRNDALLVIEPPEPVTAPPSGVIVLPRIGGTKETTSAKEAMREFKDIVGKRLPLSPAPDIASARRILHDEFPYACSQVDTLLTGMIEGEPIRWRNCLLTGAAGGGKSRLVRRLAEALRVGLHRYDASSASDNAFGGTPRRWASGEHSTPLEAVRHLGVANPLLLIDEIDKAGTARHNGSIAGALLPFLEPETARAHHDLFIEATVDLSHIGYMLTANEETSLSGPLRDRLLVVRIPEPGVEHLPTLARTIVVDIAKEKGGDGRWWPGLNDGEMAIAEHLWPGGSVRRLRGIVERILSYRETNPRN